MYSTSTVRTMCFSPFLPVVPRKCAGVIDHCVAHRILYSIDQGVGARVGQGVDARVDQGVLWEFEVV